MKIFETIEDFKPIINIGQFADKFNLKSRVRFLQNWVVRMTPHLWNAALDKDDGQNTS